MPFTPKALAVALGALICVPVQSAPIESNPLPTPQPLADYPPVLLAPTPSVAEPTSAAPAVK